MVPDEKGTNMARASDSDIEKLLAGSLRDMKAEFDSFKKSMHERQDLFEKKIQSNTEMTEEVVEILKNARGFFATVDSLANFAKKVWWIGITIGAGWLVLREWMLRKVKGGSDG